MEITFNTNSSNEIPPITVITPVLSKADQERAVFMQKENEQEQAFQAGISRRAKNRNHGGKTIIPG